VSQVRFDRTTTRRELEIIGTDLHCNAVRIVTDPALATWPWFSGKQTTPVMPLNMSINGRRRSREAVRRTTMTVSGGYMRAGGDPDTEGYFDASG
jgi:hypothetical protein